VSRPGLKKQEGLGRTAEIKLPPSAKKGVLANDRREKSNVQTSTRGDVSNQGNPNEKGGLNNNRKGIQSPGGARTLTETTTRSKFLRPKGTTRSATLPTEKKSSTGGKEKEKGA